MTLIGLSITILKTKIFLNQCKIKYYGRMHAKKTDKIVKLLIFISNHIVTKQYKNIGEFVTTYKEQTKKVINWVETAEDKTIFSKLTMSFYDRYK